MACDSKVIEISKRLRLPVWWVETVIVEYFPCRCYANAGKLCTFDFNRLTDSNITEIPRKNVALPNCVLLQNIRPDDFRTRGLLRMFGFPCVPISNERTNIIPEGPANSTFFPDIHYDISEHDPKRGFKTQAIIHDDGIFYQWTIAETYHRVDKPQLWYRSDLFDLTKLLAINDKLNEYENSDQIRDPTPEFTQQIKAKYAELESERVIIRDKIWKEHLIRKPDKTMIDMYASNPPSLSYLDAVKFKDGKYETETQMEPLLLRSAIRNLNRAVKANEKIGGDPKNYNALLDEIEYSTMCIINSVNCLEAYINSVIDTYLKIEFDKNVNVRGVEEKWRWVPNELNLKQKFKPSTPPFSNLSNLVTKRNNIIHYTTKFKRTQGRRSYVHNQFNVQSAKKAVKTVKEMVEALSSDKTIPLPFWIKTDIPSMDYWDEVIKYLRQI